MTLTERIDRAAYRIAYVMAALGGIVLVAVMLMTTISIFGRSLVSLGLGPIPGDFELVSAGTAFCIFAFLPWCQLRRGHVTVDLFLSSVGPRVNYFIDIVANVLMTAATTVIAWRLYAGMLDKAAYNETSFILQYPVWWAYAVSLIGAVIFAFISLYTVWRSVREFRTGKHVFYNTGHTS